MTSLSKLLFDRGHSLRGCSSWLLEFSKNLIVIIILIQIQDITWFKSISTSATASFVVELFII